jgi:hypothetical protein
MFSPATPTFTNYKIILFELVLYFRLNEYSSFTMTNKLHTMLGSMEDKVHQAKSQGTSHNVDRSLLRLSHKFAPSSKYYLLSKYL